MGNSPSASSDDQTELTSGVSAMPPPTTTSALMGARIKKRRLTGVPGRAAKRQRTAPKPLAGVSPSSLDPTRVVDQKAQPVQFASQLPFRIAEWTEYAPEIEKQEELDKEFKKMLDGAYDGRKADYKVKFDEAKAGAVAPTATRRAASRRLAEIADARADLDRDLVAARLAADIAAVADLRDRVRINKVEAKDEQDKIAQADRDLAAPKLTMALGTHAFNF